MLAQYPQIRAWLYAASAALSAVGIVVTVIHTEIGAALLSASASLSIAAGATAANNITPTAAKK